MINIAICDDSEQDIELLRKEIERYQKEKYVKFNVNLFSKPEMLIYELQDSKVADIYILDVSMPHMNGFELAEEIRKHTQTAVIIFLTSMCDMAVEGYKVRALRYIIKLNLTRDIQEALDSSIAELEKPNDKIITLHRYRDYWRIPYGDIIFVTRVTRQLNIVTNSHGEITDNRGITEFYNLLDDDRFLFIDRSCFVNIDYILGIAGFDLKLKNGTVLPISRRSLQNVKQVLLERWGI